MKTYEAFFLSLITSLLVGALLFFALPFIWNCLASINLCSPIDSFMWFALGLLYCIYIPIRFLLSGINLIQAIYLSKIDRASLEEWQVIKLFFAGEGILYLIIFLGLSLVCWEIDAMPFILAFSAPYIICCSISVFIFRYFLKKSKPLHDPERLWYNNSVAYSYQNFLILNSVLLLTWCCSSVHGTI